MVTETTFNGCKGIERIVILRAVCGNMVVATLRRQSVSNTEEQVCTTTCGVIDMYELVLGLGNLGRYNLRNQGDNIIWSVLLTSSGCRNVSPLAFDMLFESSNVRI